MKLTTEFVYLAIAVAKIIAFIYCFVHCLVALCEFLGVYENDD